VAAPPTFYVREARRMGFSDLVPLTGAITPFGPN